MNKLLFIIISLSSLLATAAIAQTPETLLTYGRNVEGQFSTVFISSDGSRVDYSSQQGMCGDLSPNGQLNARSQLQNPTTVELIYTPSNTIFGRVPWRTDWYPCSPDWINDTTLVIRNLDNFNDTSVMFRLQNNVLRGVPVTFPPTPQVPSLPRADMSGLQYIIPSNNRNKFVYFRCMEEISLANECTGRSEWIIYDVMLNREIGVLSDLDDQNVRGNRGWGDSPPGLARFYTWSPDDRYFLYAAFSLGGFSIYDTFEERQLDVPDQNWNLDLNRLPVWSPDSRYIAYWSTGVPDVNDLDGISLIERYGITNEEQSRLFSGLQAYDAWEERELPIEVYLQNSTINQPIVWSPNTPEIVTWDNEGNLYRLNIETSRFPTLIDTLVSGVIAWSFVQPIPTVDLPTLIPTPTPTPLPTPTPTPSPTPAAFQRLRVSAMCSDDPATSRRWRIRNPNPYPVPFTWEMYNSPSGQQGTGTAPVAVNGAPSAVILTTPTERWIPVIEVTANNRSDLAINLGIPCDWPSWLEP